jgi:hypothetical protein
MNRRQSQLKIIDALKRIDGRTSPWNPSYTFNLDLHDNVLDHDEFVDNINSFPCVMLTITDTQIFHIGGGERYVISAFRIRGITWDEQVEDAGELLADDIEHAISKVRQDHPDFEEIRIDTVQTDEGLNAPLGAVIVQGTMVYRHD